MKKFIVTLLLNFSFLIFNSSFAQVVIEWQKSLGGTDYEEAYSVKQTSDGGYLVAGTSKSNDGDITGNHGVWDYWVVKLDGLGNLQWQKSLGGTDEDFAYSIQQTSDGGYVVAGYSSSSNGNVTGNHGSADFWVVKLGSTGNVQWQKSLGGTDEDVALSIRQTADGGYVVAGYTYSNDGDVLGNYGGNDYWVVKLNSSGNIQWQICLGGTNSEEARSVQQTFDGGYVVAGYSRSNNGNVTINFDYYDYWIVKLDAGGNLQWQQSLGGTAYDRAQSIQQANDGGYLVAGYSGSNNGFVAGNHGGNDYWIIKLDSSGNFLWQKCLGGTGWDEAYSLQQTTDGGFVVAGRSVSNDGDVTGNHGGWDYWIIKIDNIGNLQWQKSLGGTGIDWAHSAQQTADGGYVVAGLSTSNNGDVTGNHGGWDYWVVKLSPFVGIEEVGDNIASSVFPNPFSTSATIRFGRELRNATFTLYNLPGEVVSETSNINGESFQIDRGNIPGGVYFYEVKDLPAGRVGEGESIARGKVVIL